jgi:hypothetical protein
MQDDVKAVERELRRAAEQSSVIQRQMAEAKSLRQEGNEEGRTDLYMWPEPERTLEGRAAATLAALQERCERLEREYTEMRSYVSKAGEILAPHSADAPGTPTRDALVQVNAALHPQARAALTAASSQPAT